MSKEKGILFTTAMAQAILSGDKTQTRRVLRTRPSASVIWSEKEQAWYGEQPEHFDGHDKQFRLIKLPYHASDIIYIKETYATGIEGCPVVGDYSGVTYRADHQDPRGDGPAHPIKWRSSMFMPKALARTWLEVLAVRVERLQDINREDAIAEGLTSFVSNLGARNSSPVRLYQGQPWDEGGFVNPIEAFENAWDKINAKRGYPWEANPWVGVYAFRRIER